MLASTNIVSIQRHYWTREDKEVESRRERFRRLAKKRAEKLADELRKIGNLGSQNYEYSEEEVDKLFTYIQERVQDSRSKFNRFSKSRVPSLEL